MLWRVLCSDGANVFLAACFTMSEGSLLRLNKALRFYNFLQRREGERLS